MLAALQPAREKLEAVLVPMQDARNDTEESRSSQEQSFAAVLLSAVGGRRSEPGTEADGVLRRALQLARTAGFQQPQAQGCSTGRLGLSQPAPLLCAKLFAGQKQAKSTYTSQAARASYRWAQGIDKPRRKPIMLGLSCSAAIVSL